MRTIGRAKRRRKIIQVALGASLALLVFGPIMKAPGAPASQVAQSSSAAPQPAATPTAPTAAASTVIGTAITQGASGPPGTKVVTLDQVVALAISNNSNVILARQRLRKSEEGIVQINAETRPQVNASLVDTYSSVDSFSTSGVTVSTPSLPAGGQIPTVTDQGGGNTGTFTGGGDGGTVNSSGPSLNLGAIGTSTGVNGTSTSGTSSTSSTGTGATGGTRASGGINGAPASPRAMAADLLPILQRYASVTAIGVQTGQAVQAATEAKQPATKPNASTPPTSSNGTFTNGSRGQRNNYAGRVNVTQYIDLFGFISAAKDVENITRDFYQLDLTRIQNEAALSSKDFFFNVLRDQETVNVDQEQVTSATENVRIAQAKFTAGTAAQFDVLTAQVTLTNDQQALQTALNQLNIDRANLNNLIGIDPNTEITLKAPPLPPLDQPVDLKQSTAIALKQRPELREAGNNITIAKKLIKLAGASLQPSLGVGAGASYSGPTNTNNSSFDLSAQLNFPLSDGGATKSRIRQADIDLQTQLTTQSQLEQNITLEVRQAYLNVNNAQNQAGTAGVGVTQAEEAVRLAQVRFQYGIGTFLDVINAQAQLAIARNNLATAQYDYQTSLAQLVRAEGGR